LKIKKIDRYLLAVFIITIRSQSQDSFYHFKMASKLCKQLTFKMMTSQPLPYLMHKPLKSEHVFSKFGYITKCRCIGICRSRPTGPVLPCMLHFLLIQMLRQMGPNTVATIVIYRLCGSHCGDQRLYTYFTLLNCS